MFETIQMYCERQAPGLLQEPFNLMAAVSYQVAALDVWRKSSGITLLRWMAVGIMILGLSVLSQHLVPSRFTVTATLVFTVLLAMGYFFAVNRDMLGMSGLVALVCTLLILPFAAVSMPLVLLLKGAGGSFAFVAYPVLLLGYAVLLRPDHPATARGLSLAAAVMVLGLVARSLDTPLCARLPSGTQFVWTLSVATLLWLLARIYRAHMLAAGAADR